MSDLKTQLIKLGSTNPELRPHIREILKSASSKLKWQKSTHGEHTVNKDKKEPNFGVEFRKKLPNGTIEYGLWASAFPTIPPAGLPSHLWVNRDKVIFKSQMRSGDIDELKAFAEKTYTQWLREGDSVFNSFAWKRL